MLPYMLLLLLYTRNANGQDFDADCITPTGLASHCVSLNNCDKLKPLIRLPANERETLKSWHCGYDGDVPKVCCPPTMPKTRCHTAIGNTGICVSVQACPEIVKRLNPPVSNEDLEYVMLSKCKGPGELNVCCDEPSRKPTTAIDKELTDRVKGTTSTPSQAFSVIIPTTSEKADPLPQNDMPKDDNDNVLPFDDTPNCESVDIPDPNSGCCGVESSGGNKIFGGNATTIDQYPWLALIEYPNLRWVCGGSLISRRWVLTAAHCLVTNDMKSRDPQSVRLGDYNITNPGIDCVEVEGGGIDCITEPVSIKIEQAIVHPQYKAPKTIVESNDIALLRLKDLAPYNDFIRPICLPVSDMLTSPPIDMRLFVAGWGAISETRSTSDVKFHVDLPLYEKTSCNKLYSIKGKPIIWEKQVCAGGEENKDSCQGDSGGPLMFAEREKAFHIIGVTSFGVKQCGFKGRPSIYTKVYSYSDWIRSQAKP